MPHHIIRLPNGSSLNASAHWRDRIHVGDRVLCASHPGGIPAAAIYIILDAEEAHGAVIGTVRHIYSDNVVRHAGCSSGLVCLSFDALATRNGESTTFGWTINDREPGDGLGDALRAAGNIPTTMRLWNVGRTGIWVIPADLQEEPLYKYSNRLEDFPMEKEV